MSHMEHEHTDVVGMFDWIMSQLNITTRRIISWKRINVLQKVLFCWFNRNKFPVSLELNMMCDEQHASIDIHVKKKIWKKAQLFHLVAIPNKKLYDLILFAD